MKRNEFLKRLGFGAAAIGAGENLLFGCMKHDMEAMNAVAPTIQEGAFSTRLPFLKTENSGAALKAGNQTHALVSGKPANVLGYNNGLLGPLIRVERGVPVTVPFTNSLAEDTNVHWHGLLVPAGMDGHPDQLIKPGQSFTYSFTLQQPAGMAWYHPHPHMNTGRQVYKGLAGVFIVDSPEERALKLPAGDQELVLVIQDKRLDAAGAPVYTPTMPDIMVGYMGDTIVINGVNAPFHPVATRTYRLRVLNGSNGRIYNLALSNGDAFHVIGSDAGLLPAPQQVGSLLLAPGERVDLLVDFSKTPLNSDVFLQSNTFSGVDSQGAQTFRLVRFRVERSETDTFKMPVSLPSLTSLSPSSASKTRKFIIGSEMHSSGGHQGKNSMAGMHTINGKTYDASRIDESVALNSTEIWEFDNSMGDEPHPMHLHGTFFQVVGRVGGRGTLVAHEKGWKDTVLVMPKETVRVLVRF
jgi:blue copper oxidase